MAVNQRDIVEVQFPLPGGSLKPHPVIVISNNQINEWEDAFIGVMLSSKDYDDPYTFKIMNAMLTKKPKTKYQARSHLIRMFDESQITKRGLGSLCIDPFNHLIDHIFDSVMMILPSEENW